MNPSMTRPAAAYLPGSADETGWSAQWWGNSAAAWTWAAVGAVIGVLVALAIVRVVRSVILPRADSRDSVTLAAVLAGLEGIRARLLVPIAAVLAANALTFPEGWAFWLRMLLFTLVGVQIAVVVNRMLVMWIRRPAERGGQVPVMTSVLTWAAQFLVWLTVVLALLTNAGVNISAFVASLGVGGIAVALGLQTILGDLFASISIGLDKPFEPGDYIAFGTDEGTVIRVGIKSTRIAALSGEELAISNSQLLQSLLHNYTRMPTRRIDFTFAVPFTTPTEAVETIVARTAEIIAAQPSVRFDRGHLTGFGDAGYTFSFVYILNDPAFAAYRDAHQDILRGVMALLAELDVSPAVPVRAVTVTGSAD